MERRTCSRQSFREAELFVGSEEASYTILSLVVLADSLITGMCGKSNTSLSVVSLVHKLVDLLYNAFFNLILSKVIISL